MRQIFSHVPAELDSFIFLGDGQGVRTSSRTDKGQVLLHPAWQTAGTALQRFLVGTLQAPCKPFGAIMRNLYFRERWAQGLVGLSEKLYNSHNLLLQLVSHWQGKLINFMMCVRRPVKWIDHGLLHTLSF